MHREITHWVVLIVANVPLYLVLGWLFFRSWSGFFEEIKYLLTDARSFEDTPLKLFVFAALCSVLLWQEHARWHRHDAFFADTQASETAR